MRINRAVLGIPMAAVLVLGGGPVARSADGGAPLTVRVSANRANVHPIRRVTITLPSGWTHDPFSLTRPIQAFTSAKMVSIGGDPDCSVRIWFSATTIGAVDALPYKSALASTASVKHYMVRVGGKHARLTAHLLKHSIAVDQNGPMGVGVVARNATLSIMMPLESDYGPTHSTACRTSVVALMHTALEHALASVTIT